VEMTKDIANRSQLRALMGALRPTFERTPPAMHAWIWTDIATSAIRQRARWHPQDYPTYLACVNGAASQARSLLAPPGSPFDPMAEEIARETARIIERQQTDLTHPDSLAWIYQYYRAPDAERVRAHLRDGKKVSTRHELAAATQFWTEPYMVQWLLQNSLGRSYHEAYPDSMLPQTWSYYIRQRPDGQDPPEHPRPLADLDLIDPCCGAGILLREALDMFATMYRERYRHMEMAVICDLIFQNHLHGVDIDPLVVRICHVVLYLRAWELVCQAGGEGYSLPTTHNIVSPPSAATIRSMREYLIGEARPN
jgi:hypothetical protein